MTELVDIRTKGTKEGHELGLALKSILVKIRDEKRDGWQAGNDISAAVMGSLNDLLKAADGVMKIAEEGKEKPYALAIGLLIPLCEGMDALSGV